MNTPSEAEVRRRLAAADATYEPFAPLSAWAHEPVGLGSWDDAAARLAEVRSRTLIEDVRAALDEVLRAAAVDTGAIEGLYAADRGFTLSVARNVISLDQAEVEAGLGFRRSFEAQLAGFELALQMATGDEVVTEAALREVHSVTCAGQDSYRVLTPAGVQERPLPRGSYKTDPNHVQMADGSFHSYAPVDGVSEEMGRLVAEMRSEAFLSAPAVVQAAFSHQALTAIHPFADGNGRVARLLASVWLLRAASIPLWVETTDRERYLDALGAADRGDHQPFLRLVTSLSLSLMRELAIAVQPVVEPEEPDEPSAEETAAEAAAAFLAEALGRSTERDRGAEVRYPFPLIATAPDEVNVLPDAALLFGAGGIQPAPGFGTRAVAVGVRRGAEEWGRICVMVFDQGLEGQLADTHEFEVDEVSPAITPTAARRLEALARVLASGSRREALAARVAAAESDEAT